MQYFGQFSTAVITDYQVQGHLKDFLEKQRDGLGGNYPVMGYPYNTDMWDGGVKYVLSRECVYKSPEFEISSGEIWWPYEQSAYLLDGLLKLGYLLQEERFIQLVQRNFRYLLDHPDDKGILGCCYSKDRSQWPMIVMFRPLAAYYRITGDEKIKEALHKHFLAIPEDSISSEYRHINMLEGMLTVYSWTGDRELLDRAVRAYDAHDRYCAERRYPEENELRFGKLTGGRNFTMHGVSFSESVKLPVLLYLYTGDRKYLTAAEEGLADVLSRHEQIPGLVSSNEYLSGRDPLQGYESCLLSDFTWALGYFLMATGKTEYADRIEKIIYNALPGAISKDFTALQYLSAPNQVTATPQSCNSHQFFMYSPVSQYRPDHYPQCCPGNIQRAMPNFIYRMFMKKEDDSPVATLYGPVIFRNSFRGIGYTITEETEYPYDETIRFVFHCESALTMPFSFRIPAWCSAPRMTVCGAPEAITAADGFCTVTRTWQDGDVLELVLPMEIRQISDRQWSHFEYGPLVFSYPVPTETVRENPGERFSPLFLNPKGQWNWAIAPGSPARVRKVCSADQPLDRPPLELEVEAMEIPAYGQLTDQRFTPRIPVFCSSSGRTEKITLVPMGATMLRVTAFPDAVKREPVHLFNVRCLNRTYPYDVRRPLAEQHFLPERMTAKEFDEESTQAQMKPGLYFDMKNQLGAQKNVMGYVKFGFYSHDYAGPAVFMISASDAAVGYYEGKQFCEIQGVSEGEFMEPQWFRLNISTGWTELLFKVAESDNPMQYYDSWGIKVIAFH